jgi:Uma2 family endonuclease
MAQLAKEMRLTYAEYARLPDTGKRYELHEGRLTVVPSPSSKHQIVLGNLFERLHAYARVHQLGRVFAAPIDLVLSQDSVCQSDLLFLRQENSRFVSDRGIEGPPDLVVEVLSEGTEARDRREKFQLYFLFGVPEYWIIDLERKTLEMYRRTTDRYELVRTLHPQDTLDSPRFPGLSLQVEELWA